MPKKRRTFTPAQVARVRKLHNEGRSRHTIANSVGLSVSSLEWHLRDGTFGYLKSRRGQNTAPRKKIDCEKTQTCFGRPKKAWQGERDRIKKSWSSDEAARRSRSILPNRERPFGLGWIEDDTTKKRNKDK